MQGPLSFVAKVYCHWLMLQSFLKQLKNEVLLTGCGMRRAYRKSGTVPKRSGGTAPRSSPNGG